MNLTYHDIACALNLPSFGEGDFLGVTIDSRQVRPGGLFIAIRGERFDGHDFITQAQALGAAAVVCEQPIPNSTIHQLVVPSTLQALAAIAKSHRQKFLGPVIAVTGSNGKTTVKEMIARLLSKPSFATPGNLNNHIGVPLSVFQLQEQHRSAVFELGASQMGDIAHTVSIIQPQVSLVNNIAPAHIAGFGSIEGVARAKGEIYQGLISGGTRVINDDDVFAHFWDDMGDLPYTSVRFSREHTADVSARSIVFNDRGCAKFQLETAQGDIEIQLQVPGYHNVSNALAAVACCSVFEGSLKDIQVGLETFSGVAGRMTQRVGKHRSIIIDDTYNANLSSTLMAVDVLASQRGTRILVLGDMAELGEWSEPHHEAVGFAAREKGIDGVMTCGTLSARTTGSFGSKGKHYDNQGDLIQDLLSRLDSKTTVLVKGSRSAAMEQIVQQLIE